MTLNGFHAAWPPLTALVFAFILALQIPREALFFRPAPVKPTQNFASFVTYEPEAYTSLVQQVRMSWQVRTTSTDSEYWTDWTRMEVDEKLREPLPPLELDEQFFALPPCVEETQLTPPALLPPSLGLAAARPLRRPRSDAQAMTTSKLNPALLRLPDSLQEAAISLPPESGLDTPFHNPIQTKK